MTKRERNREYQDRYRKKENIQRLDTHIEKTYFEKLTDYSNKSGLPKNRIIERLIEKMELSAIS